jgi:methanesulfonate monooxygenase small subunit
MDEARPHNQEHTMSMDRVAIEELIYQSCTTLDQSDYPGFLGLCDPQFEYRLSAFSPEIRKDMTWLDHDRAEMEDLFNTLPKHNYDHSPLTRNAVVYRVRIDGAQASAVTALQIFRTALNGGATEVFAVGKYYDTISLAGPTPTLLKRHVKLDTRDLGWGSHIPF